MTQKHRRFLFSCGVAFAFFVADANAAGQVGVRDKTTAATITDTSGNCLAQNNSRSSLTIDASASGTNIGYCLGPGCTAAIGTTGTTTITAGSLHFWPAGSAPTSAFCFIAVSGSQPVTIREGQ